MPRSTAVLALTVAGATLACAAVSDGATTHRTSPLSAGPGGAPLNAPVSNAVLARSGNIAAFVTAATNVTADPKNDAFSDVYTVTVPSGRRLLVSRGVDGGPADGPSASPALSTSGLAVAFVSAATNLVADDTNGIADVFATYRGKLVLVSRSMTGGAANGPSSQPSISADGRFVVFTSIADNLVPNDHNGETDVFVRDLAAGTTRRVSVTPTGGDTDGPSSAPVISSDGSTIAFESGATNLVAGDTNRVHDVFVRTSGGTIERVSVSTSGQQQNLSVLSPFTPSPDLSADGRYVVFDTNASNLFSGDRNNRSDIYLRDRRKDTTTLVSASSLNVQGNNDSVTPRISSSGRFISFQSFASNLVPFDGPSEDLFVRDMRQSTTSLLNATDSGATRDREPGGQLLQEPAVSDDGRRAVFLSGAANVATGAGKSVQLYLRDLTAPTVKLRGIVVRTPVTVRVRLQASGAPRPRYLCRIDDARPYYCSSGFTLKKSVGLRLTVRAGAPGVLWSKPVSVVINPR